jgi:hypothetical protein
MLNKSGTWKRKQLHISRTSFREKPENKPHAFEQYATKALYRHGIMEHQTYQSAFVKQDVSLLHGRGEYLASC